MNHHPLLGPVVGLLGWSVIMLLWMFVTRFPAMKAAGIDIRTRVGSKPGQLDGVLPPEVQWIAHNYNHLMEQPTMFYAACLALVAMGAETPIGLWSAWGYVGLRVLHSLEQGTRNRIRIRFPLFFVASLCLIALVIMAIAAALVS